MRRLFWLGMGAVAGASGTVWAERKVRSRLDALQPEHLVVVAGNRAKSLGRGVVDAVVEGRDAMRAREAELRDRLAADRGAGVGAELDLRTPPYGASSTPVRGATRPMSAPHATERLPARRHR